MGEATKGSGTSYPQLHEGLGKLIKRKTIAKDGDIKFNNLEYFMAQSLEMQSLYNLESYEKVELYNEKFNVKIRTKNYKLNGKMFFEYYPYPKFSIELEKNKQSFVKHDYLESDITFNNLKIQVILNTFPVIYQNKEPIKSIKFESIKDVNFDKNKKIKKTIFFLINFKKIINFEKISYEKIKNGKKIKEQFELGRLKINFDNWIINIDNINDLTNRIRYVEYINGNIITHICSIEKENNKDYKVSEVINIIDKLQLILSFIRGQWISPVLSYGIDKNDNIIWKDFDIKGNDKYSYKITCLPINNKIDFNNIIKGYMNLLEKEFYSYKIGNRSKIIKWEEIVKRAVTFYLNANNTNTSLDALLINAQIVLELLSWAILVQSKKIISGNDFKKLSASNKIRLLLKFLEINTEIPIINTQLINTINGIKNENDIFDGVYAITYYRNAFVHPGEQQNIKKLDSITINTVKNELFQTYNISMLYIELILLYLFEYSGNYFNRVTNKFEKVPYKIK